MPFLKDCFFLLLTPNGRAGQITYIVGGVVTRMIAMVAWRQLYADAFDNPAGLHAYGGVYAGLTLAAVWMWFCLCSRRLHDAGISNMIMVPLLVAQVAVVLAMLDPTWLVSPGEGEGPGATIASIAVALDIIMLPLGLYLVKAASDDGDNAYGPPFGEARDRGWTTSDPATNLQTTHRVVGQTKVERRAAGDRAQVGSGDIAGGLPKRAAAPTAGRKGFGKR